MFMEGNTWEGENVEWGRNTAELKFKKIYEFITIHQAIFLCSLYDKRMWFRMIWQGGGRVEMLPDCPGP